MSKSLRAMRAELGAAVTGAAHGRVAADELCLVCVDLLGVDGAAVSVVFEGVTRGTFGSSNALSRRLDEHQFTSGEGPSLDAAARRAPSLAPDLASPDERRWPMFAGSALDDGVRGVFAMPIVVASVSVGALGLYRRSPGPLPDRELAAAGRAAELASLTLLDQLDQLDQLDHGDSGKEDDAAERPEQGADHVGELDRIEVYQATGMLISQLDVGPDEALARLRAHAVASGRTASEVAWDVVERRLVIERDNRDGPRESQR